MEGLIKGSGNNGSTSKSPRNLVQKVKEEEEKAVIKTVPMADLETKFVIGGHHHRPTY